MTKGLWCALLLPLITCLPIIAGAHDMNLARYRIQVDEAELRLTLTVPATFGTSGEISWPPGCSQTDRTLLPLGNMVRLTARAHCTESLDASARIIAPWGADGAVLESAGGAVTVIAAREGAIALPLDVPGAGPRPLPRVLGEYLTLGVVHILEGWDHLAFVLCLFLLARGSFLLWLVTAFTLGHSVSLALAYGGVLNIPIVPTEAVIALSIAFMAREALLDARAHGPSIERGARDPIPRTVLIVVGFGLIHGLGFASVLGDLGVASGERTIGLLAFNVGVELGQLLFVSALLAAWWLCTRMAIERPARITALFAAGSVGAYWFIERVAGFV